MTAKNKNTPLLRFKEYNKEWDSPSIQTLLDKKIILSHLDGNHGGLYPRSEEFTSNGVPYITANDFLSGKVSFENCKHLPKERASQFKKGIAKDGDVLFAHNATVGPTALLETDLKYVILSTTATYYRCDNKTLFNRYLQIYFQTKAFVQQYSRVMSQSTRNQVPITTQRNFTVDLPTFPEQQKIAIFLFAIDEKIHQLTRRKELLEQYKKGAMQQLFSGRVRFKDEKGKSYPKWQEKELRNVCSFFSGGTPKSTHKIYYTGNIPFIGSGNIYDSEVSSFISEEALNNSSAKIVKKGDLLYALYGANSGELAISKISGAINQAVLCIRSTENIIYLYYVLLFSKDTIVSKYLQGGQGNLSADIVKKLKFNFPSIMEQIKIASFLSRIDTKIESVSGQIERTQRYKKGLLQQMFV